MSLLASQPDFEPATPEEGATALYYNPDMPDGVTGYRLYPMFQMRIDQLKGRLQPNNQKVAIWGCAFGYLVQLAVGAGYDAHGFDASAYAVQRASQILPANIASRIHLRSALVAADVTASRADAGLSGNQRFALLLTEDMLTCMSDAEINTCLPLLRASSQANLGHMVTTIEEAGTGRDARINWKTVAQWKALLSPPDQVISGTYGTVL
jgi:hypothetical protein